MIATMQISEPDKFLNVWMQLVNDRDLDGVLGLYDESAVLIPTFSNRLLSKPERIREYFETLTSRRGLGLTLHERPRILNSISDTIHTLSGIYRWRFEIDDEPLDFEARFSFILDFARSAPILHHHSSQIPRML